MKQYEIKINKTQLHVISDALDFYGRFCLGQWRIPMVMENQEHKNQSKNEGFWETRNYVEDQLNILKSIFIKLPLNASYGIGSEKLCEEAKIAYDISRPIMELEALEHKENALKDGKEANYSVYDHPGLSYSKEGRINVKTIKDE